MKKRIYRKIPIKDVQADSIIVQLTDSVVVIAIDIAKHDMVAALAGSQCGIVATIAWTHPTQSPQWLALIKALQAAGKVVHAVMEPSGTYGDALRFQLQQLGVTVFRVASKRTHDAAELYDAVPSMHDAKAAAVLVRLHNDGLSTPWIEPPQQTREIKAALAVMELHHDHYLRGLNALEALLSRHWPELLQALELTSASLLALLARIGGPEQVASQPDEARALLRGISRGLMAPERIETAVQSAHATLGVPLMGVELAMLRELAQELHRALQAHKKAKQRVEALSVSSQIAPMAVTIGKTTAAVLLADVGDPRDFPCAHAYVKALGVNLKERSSGNHRGRLSFTKRGSARARKYLWFAVLRWIQKDRIAAAWYRSKVARDGGKPMRALGARHHLTALQELQI
jgi:transposase